MASVSTMSASDAESIPPSTPTRSATTNATANATNPSTSDPTSSSKRTVVTARRKEELLVKARSERKQWVGSIPLPFDPELLPNKHETKKGATNRLWSSREGLDQFQSSLVFHDRLLQGATCVLSELYGIGSAVDDTKEKDEFDGTETGEDADTGKILPNRPLSIDNVAERVGKLTKPFLEDEEHRDHEPANSANDISGQSAKAEISIDESGASRGDDQKAFLDDKYGDVIAAYEEFAAAMLLPESAVTVQGMKNFVRNFASTGASKKNGEDDDKLVRNMASIVNGQIRSSYESLPTKNNSNSVASDTQGNGHPDWDRRSLESFVYGQVKTVIDETIDRILGNGEGPQSPDSPFPMTQMSFDARLEELQFLQPSHLELACLKDDNDSSTSQKKLETLLEMPIKALQSIESFYSPYEKLSKVLEVYHSVNTVLKNASESVPMADDVISAMILVIVKASAAQTKASLKSLLRDLHFVENFTLQEYKRLGGGEAEYAFTSLYGAVYFLQGVELDYDREESHSGNKSNRLTISNEDLRRGLEKSRAIAAKKNGKFGAAKDGDNTDSDESKGLISRGIEQLLGEIDYGGSSFVPTPRQLSVREVRAARLRGKSLNLEWAMKRQEEQPETEHCSGDSELAAASPIKSPSRSVFTPQRYTYLGVRPENIKLSDLPRLLDEYRKLVLANEQLLGEHQRANNKMQMERKRLRDEKHRRTLGEQALLFGDAVSS